MNTHPHIIRRQLLEIEVPDLELADRLQDDLVDWLNTSAGQRIDTLFEQMGMTDHFVQIDQLNLDLQVVPEENWLGELENQLINALKIHLTTTSTKKKPSLLDEKIRVEKVDQSWKLWEHFLHLGYLPWWSDGMEWVGFQKEILQTFENQPEKLQLLKNWLASDEHTLHRLCSQFSKPFLQQLDLLLHRSADAGTEQLVLALSAFFEEIGLADRMPILFWKIRISGWLSTPLNALSAMEKEIFQLLQQERSLLTKSHQWWKVAPAGDRRLIFRHLFLPFSQFLKRGDTLKLEKQESRLKYLWEKQLMRWTKEKESIAELPVESPLEADSPFPTELASDEKSGEVNPILPDQKIPPHTEMNLNSDPSKSESIEHISYPKTRMEPEVKEPSEEAEGRAEESYPSDETEPLPIERLSREERGSEDDTSFIGHSPWKGDAFEQPFGLPRMFSTDMDGIFRKELAEGIYINNVGLVLAHPFLSHFFTELKLIKGDQFVSPLHQQRAVCLCQHLVTGHKEFAEFELLFPKILCGWPIEQTLDSSISVTPHEQMESNELLLSLIEHWGVLKNTDAAGLRENFLQRDGKVSRNQGRLSIQVAQETQDILLTRLPWGLNMIRLPWLSETLYTEWV
jgi:hypothetical protein